MPRRYSTPSSICSATRTSTSSSAFRAFGGAQSYPSRTKDVDDVDFSTGSVGLGVAMTSFASLVQDYIHAKDGAHNGRMGRMVALVGDAELDEGNIYEALLEGFKHGLRNTWWIIDYNRQSLDAVLTHLMTPKLESLFDNMGWRVVTVKYGRKLEALRGEPGGDRILRWIDECDNALYSALAFEGGAGWRRELERDLKGEREGARAHRVAGRRRSRRTDDRSRRALPGDGARSLPGRPR
jgi:pyruvate dehydrogenase E1 component